MTTKHVKHMSRAKNIKARNQMKEMIRLVDVADTELSGFAYAIHTKENPHLVKFGYTHDVNQRRKQLQIGNPCELVTLWSCKFDNKRDAEKFFHTAFSKYRIGTSEWFNFSPIQTSRLIKRYIVFMQFSVYSYTLLNTISEGVNNILDTLDNMPALLSRFGNDENAVISFLDQEMFNITIGSIKNKKSVEKLYNIYYSVE